MNGINLFSASLTIQHSSGKGFKAAIDQINRYRTGHIILLNGEFANKRVSGLFRLNALDQAVDSLKAAVPGIQIRTLTPYLIVLS
ncbi:MAG: hypothetical protein HOO93_10070 [Methyloglobulus sp.]|nr:hypothetical protein [Methyloglobulus sp.]